ncbi:MAG: hypothetical protein U0L05_03265 [Schaedlerella sp.]|nr:hypothetical protein [Schaedlerella sp.]
MLKIKKMATGALLCFMCLTFPKSTLANDVTSNNIASTEDGIVITVNTETEMQTLLEKIEQSTISAEATYMRALETGQSQNPNYSNFTNINETVSISPRVFTETDVAFKTFTANGSNHSIGCYATYDQNTNSVTNVKTFGTIYGRTVYLPNDGSVGNIIYSSNTLLDSKRTLAFSYSCTVTVETLTGQSFTRRLTVYCEFYASGGYYCN